MVGYNTENRVVRSSGGGAQLPIPRIIITNHVGAGISSFDNSPVAWFNEIFVRFPDTATELMGPGSDPLLELAWCRQGYRYRAGRPNSRQDRYRRWAFPDDSVIKLGGDMGGGTQVGPGGLLTRRSKWAVVPVDGGLAVPTRIELEHYYRMADVSWWIGPLYSDRDQAPMLKPTFLKYRRYGQPFSVSQINPLSKVPRYHGYEHGYFSFAFSIKDPNGQNPGDRITGPMAPAIRVIVCNEQASFPIRYAADGTASFVGGKSLKMEFA